ncbi:MAG TPA: MucB/RseB C-terminal domain-containing protein [Burkholderiaceae bacterium]|nr:MucB/RseB C-terminal domain-containing protein [Burkholderiaceae bacterium]
MRVEASTWRSKASRLASCLGVSCVGLGAAVGGLPGAAVAADPAPARTETQWLEAIRHAAEQQTYRGLFVYTQGDSMRTSRVVHTVQDGVPIERVQPLDGRMREYLRRGDSVECFYHDDRRVVVSQGPRGARFPALVSAAPEDILRHYALEVEGRGRVAGNNCQLIRLTPRDDLRYGYDLCVEPASGLALKVRTRDQEGRQIDQMAFSDVRIGEPVDASELRPSWPAVGWTREENVAQQVDLERLGWAVSPPDGFRIERVVSRRLGEGTAKDAVREAYQALLSDGLATVSVFIEVAAAPSFPLDVAHRHGAASVYSRKVGTATVTVVGEVPPETVTSIARSVEFHDPH